MAQKYNTKAWYEKHIKSTDHAFVTDPKNDFYCLSCGQARCFHEYTFTPGTGEALPKEISEEDDQPPNEAA